MKDLTPLALHIRRVNEANGWNVFKADEWITEPYKFPGIIALIHSEITEAYHELEMRNWELMIEELADVKIRILDAVIALTMTFHEYFDQSTLMGATFQDDLLGAHKDASEALESYRKDDIPRALSYLAHLYMRCDHISESFAFDYDRIMLDKIKKNEARSHRHGGKKV